MNIKETLFSLIGYYVTTPGIGHTFVMLNGAAHTNATILVPTLRHSRQIAMDALVSRSDLNKKFVSLQNLDRLRGLNNPLAIDNSALLSIFSQSLKRIEELEQEIQQLKDQQG